MAPQFKPFKDKKAGEAYFGSGGLMQYMAYKKLGRPNKKQHGNHKQGSGRPKRAVPVAKEKPVVKATMIPATQKVSTKTRWESGTNRERLAAAIYDWDNKREKALNAKGDLTLN